MNTIVARCENCGAALRVDPNASRVTCEYCRVTCFVRDAPVDAPRVTIAAPPEPLDETSLTLGIAIVCGLIAVVGLVLIAFSDDPKAWVGGVPVTIFGALALVAGLGYPKKKAYLREVRQLREEGLAGRATIRAVGAGQGRQANLQLDVEAGGTRRSVAHSTTIPALLVPRVVSGAALPILVHPQNPDEFEIQWHLL